MASTIKDIAKETGLGLATISSYLNGGNVREKNRIKIEQAIEKLHFEVNEVARGLKTNKTKIIGIIIPELNNIFCAEIITEVEDVLRAHGYATMICDCRTDKTREKEAVEFLKKRQVDGLIVMPSGNSGKNFAPFIEIGKPVVLIDRMLNDIECDCVLTDSSDAIMKAVGAFVEAGHKKIGMIAGPVGVYTAQVRLNAFKQALEHFGMNADENLIVHGDYTITSGKACMRDLVEKNGDMTAVFVSNYEMSMGAIIEANEAGIRIPDDMSFIGFDNIDFAKAFVPKLSIITQPTKDIGRNAATIMLKRLSPNQESHENETIKLDAVFANGKTVKKR